MWILLEAVFYLCEHGIEPSGFVNFGEFFDKLSDCQISKKDSAPWS
jgi:hypothetical protein